MNTHVTRLSFACSLALAMGANAAGEDHYTFDLDARLSGAQEVTPPSAPSVPSLGVITDARATVRVEVEKNLSSFRFRLIVRNGNDVTQAHLHCGRPGQNGPVVVFLSALNVQGQDVNGVLAHGTRRNEHIEPGAAACEELIGRPINNIASLAAAAFDGLIYANVHTVQNPAGEVRGQLIADEDHDSGHGRSHHNEHGSGE
jgi:CHRD domain